MKASKAVMTEYLLTQLLKQFYLQDGATRCIYTKAKEKATLKGKGGRQVRGPNVHGTWMSGQVHETEGSYPRPRGAMAGKPQCQCNCA